jgi:predicted metalloprotease
MGGTTSDNVEVLGILTYDGLRMKVGMTSPERLFYCSNDHRIYLDLAFFDEMAHRL